jgi:predicted RNA binding protein YcfA (HicA-like mRNA interferase family)
MGNLPVLKPQEVIKILQNLGFQCIRQRGSHQQYRHEDGRGTTVPYHAGRDIAPALLRKIASDIGITVEEFLDNR